ncbi:hypothetical protein ACXZ1K_07900 [Pedobacter sp. PWIIR3]
MLTNRKLKCLIYALLLALVSCSTRNIEGKYRTNSALYGFFGSRLILRNDSTFKYHFGGDLINFDDSGHYSVKGRDLLLSYYPVNLKLYQENPLELSDTSHRSYKFRIGRKKLWSYDIHGNVVKKGSALTRHKFLFLGEPRQVMRRMYLKKIK